MEPTEFTQARVRVNKEGALLLEELLRDEEDRLIEERIELPEEKRPPIHRRLHALRRVRDELYRAMEDRNW